MFNNSRSTIRTLSGQDCLLFYESEDSQIIFKRSNFKQGFIEEVALKLQARFDTSFQAASPDHSM